MAGGKFKGLESILKTVRDKLEASGIEFDVDEGRASFSCRDSQGAKVKFMCMGPGLQEAREEMESSPRDNVVMVRVDEQTRRALDAWVESGAVKSRSEAAAVFIREGLKVRQSELDQLREALSEVESAREKLRRKAGEVFGGDA